MRVVLGLIVMSAGIAILVINDMTKLHYLTYAIGGMLWIFGTIAVAFEMVKLARGKQLSEMER